MQNKASLILKKLTFYRRFSTTMHCQKSGRDIGTSAAVRYQLLSGLDGFNLAFVRNLYFIFLI